MKTQKTFLVGAVAGAIAVAILTAAFAIFPATAQESETTTQPTTFREGRDYIVLNPPLPTRAPKEKIEVLEFFNFSCPYCFRTQGHIARWKKDNDLSDVELIHQPVVFQSANGHYARLFHTIDTIDKSAEKSAELYDKVFNTIHRARRPLNSKGRLADWLDDEGLDGDRAEKIYDSFAVRSKVKRDEKIADDYGVDSTPQFAVAGKYLINTATAGSLERMMLVVQSLVERERKENPRETKEE